MKRINLTENSQGLHIEAPGSIINIRPEFSDVVGRTVCSIEILAYRDRYKDGGPWWWIDGKVGHAVALLRVIKGDGA